MAAAEAKAEDPPADRAASERGVPEGQIHSVADCTFHEADRYHSYRREGDGGGRMISYIGFAK